MKVSSRIWNEINMAKENTSSIAKYTNRRRQTNQWVDILVITVSIVSVAFYKMQSWSPIVGVLVWLVWKYATNVFPCFKQSKEELVELDALHTFYESYYNRLEHFWYLHQTGKIDEGVLMSLFFREKESEATKRPLLNRLQKSLNSSDIRESQQEADEYFNQVYNSNETNSESTSRAE